MTTKQEMSKWLGVSNALLRTLLPENAETEIFGHGMSQSEFEAFAEKESDNVDRTLAEMTLLEPKNGFSEVLNEISKDTTIVLFSRWVEYIDMWTKEQELERPVPEGPGQIWKAMLASMVKNPACLS